MIGHPPRWQTAIVRVLLVALYLLPLLWVVVTAFKSNADVLRAPNSLVFRPTVAVLSDVVSSSWAPIVTSLQIAVITTVVVLVVGLPAAYALATHRTPGWRRVGTVVLTAFLLLQMIPQPMTVIPLYSILAKWQLVDSLGGLVLADVALMTPFAVLILRPFVLSIPNALQEAAQIDGASRFRIFRSIYVPMLGNGVFTVGAIVFIITWGEFIYAINFLSDPALATVSQVLAGQTSVYSTDWNRLMSLALVTSLPILVVFLLAQRRLVHGLAVGSVKSSAPVVVLIGALDTKADEYGFLRERVEAAGCRTVLVDVGVLGQPRLAADVDRKEVASAGGVDLDELVATADRGTAVGVMARGAAALVRARHDGGGVQAVVAVGGSNAAVVFGAVAAALPFGVPKVLAATVVSGDTRPYVGTSDVVLIHPVVDVAGLNRLTRVVLADTAAVVAALALRPPVPESLDRPLAAITTFGVTTAGATIIRSLLEERGYEVVAIAGNGTGGRALEDLVRDGVVDVVVDLTTTELADDLVGGVCSAGPDRLTAAATHDVPQVVSVGALDMVNFGPPETVPAHLRGRRLHVHNAGVTLLRTDAAENAELGRRIAAKLATATAPTTVLVPRGGFSQISVPGAPFHDPAADTALIAALTDALPPHVTVRVLDLDVNDPAFAAAVAEEAVRVHTSHRRTDRSTTDRSTDDEGGGR